MDVSVLQFLRSGRFGDVRLGMSRQDVSAVLGQPTDFGGWWPSQSVGDDVAQSVDEAPLWRYGIAEFYWGEKTERLHMIHFDGTAGQIGSESGPIHYDPWVFAASSPPSKDDVGRALVDEGIGYRIATVESGLYSQFILDSGVTLSFDNEGEHKDEVAVITFVDEQFA